MFLKWNSFTKYLLTIYYPNNCSLSEPLIIFAKNKFKYEEYNF